MRFSPFLLLLVLLSLSVACGESEQDCADDPLCQPAAPCPGGCPGGGLIPGGGGAGGEGGEGGDGGGGSGGTTERPDTALCEDSCRHVYLECGGFWLTDRGGLVDHGSCLGVCLQLPIEKVRCYEEATCFEWSECEAL